MKICGQPSTSTALTVALRDFFFSASRDELALALAALPLGKIPDEAALAGLEYEFNRLFVGPQPPLAPPYASVYLEPEPRLMGAAAQKMSRFYTAMGLKEPTGGLPPDFLPLELEAWLFLQDLAEAGEIKGLDQARSFLIAHFDAWLPLFTSRMRQAPLSETMENVAALLDGWLGHEKERVWKKFHDARS